jgi:hypothetical protein
MAINPYFSEYNGEQTLLNDLVIETIKATGRDVVYIPRQYMNFDQTLGEDTQGSKFTKGYLIEMYLSDVQQFGGQRDIVSKFGIQLTDRINLVLSKTRFEQEVSSKESNIKRPREGDLIYFPMMEYLFEINFVEDKQPFFQFGKLTTYNLTCEVFNYSHETINTGNSDIDRTQTDRKEYLKVISLGSTAEFNSNTFFKGEKVFQVYGVTGATATFENADAVGLVIEFNSTYNYTTGLTANTLYIGDIIGSFVANNNSIKGLTSNAEYYVTGITSSTIVIAKNPESEDPDRDNDKLEYKTSIESIFDFTDTDPFSEGEY